MESMADSVFSYDDNHTNQAGRNKPLYDKIDL